MQTPPPLPRAKMKLPLLVQVVAGLLLAGGVIALLSHGDDPEPAKEVQAPASKPLPPDFGITASQYAEQVANIAREYSPKARVKLEAGDSPGVYRVVLPSGVAAVIKADKPDAKVNGVIVVATSAKTASKSRENENLLRELLSAAAPAEPFHVRIGIESHFIDMRREAEAFGVVAERGEWPYLLRYAIQSDYTTGSIMLGEHEAPKDAGDKSTMAYVQCMDKVRDQLKAPGSAKFPSFPERIARDPDQPNSYALVGYVDAQNTYGALLRAKWTCATSYEGGDTWAFRNVELLESADDS